MDFLDKLSVISPLFILIGCWRHRFTLLWFYAAAGFITEILTYVVTEKKTLGNCFLLLEFFILSFYYKKHLFKSKLLFATITICLSLFFILDTLINKPTNYLNLESASVFCLFYIIYGLIFFHSSLKRQDYLYPKDTLSNLGINIALFVYSSGSFMIFLFSPWALKVENELFLTLWFTVFISLNIFRYTLIAFALYQKPKLNAG